MKSASLQGRTALVTGAALRVGRGIALALAGEGVNVVIHYRSSEENAKGLQRELKESGVNCWLVQADFEKPKEYESLISRTLEQAGSLDILINSASIFPPGKLNDLDFESLTKAVQVNAWTPFVLSREFARQVKRGKIVNLLDTRVGGYDRYHVAYILSKQMLSALTKMTALEFAPDVTVNAVAPGLILPPPGKGQDYLDRLVDTVPLKRHGEPSDIADAVVYLLKSDFLTGQTIYVDGGRHIKEYGDGPHSDR